jgi:3-isopropylmalate/(R)-2-methylmalate dehydratase small subunit
MGGVVPMRIVSEMRTDPKDIVEHLFEGIIPDFHKLCQPGDLVVTGRNFGMGAKMQGYIAMKALGLGLVCESMSFLAYREAIGIGLPVLTGCSGISSACHPMDQLSVNFQTGLLVNITQDRQYQFEPVPLALQDVLSSGGTTAWLQQWWAKRQAEKHNA